MKLSIKEIFWPKKQETRDLSKSKYVKAYYKLTFERLIALRINEGQNSYQEDTALDKMDAIWYLMTLEERDYIRKNPGPFATEIKYWLGFNK